MGKMYFHALYISQDMHVAETEADWLGDAEKK